MDSRSVYTVSVYNADERFNGEDSRSAIQKRLMSFILDFHTDNAFIYRYIAYHNQATWTQTDEAPETRYERMYWSSSITVTLTSPT